MAETNNAAASKPAFRLPVAAAAGFLIGFCCAMVALVRQPLQDAVSPSKLQLSLLAVICIAFVGVDFLTEDDEARRSGVQRAVSAAAAAAAWGLVAQVVAPTTPFLVSAGFMPILLIGWCSAVKSPRSVLCVMVVGIAGVCYAWVGFRVLDLPLIPTAAFAGAIVACFILMVLGVAFDRRRDALALSAGVLALVTVVAAGGLALGTTARNHVNLEWDAHPVQVESHRVLRGLSDGAPVFFSSRPLAASGPDGEVAVMDHVGGGRYVLWRRASDTSWTRIVLSAGFVRPDGRRVFLTENAQALAAEMSLWRQLSGDDTDALRLGEVRSIALWESKVYAVSDTGLWEISESGVSFVGNPWKRGAEHRVIAIDKDGLAVVLSNYLVDGRRISEVQTIDLGDATVKPVWVDKAGDSADLPEGQWPLTGLSRFSDRRFVSLAGTDVVAIGTAASEIIGHITFNPPIAWTRFQVSGSVFGMWGGGKLSTGKFTFTSGKFATAGGLLVKDLPRTDENYCAPTGKEQKLLSWSGVNELAAGPSLYALVDAVRCRNGLWAGDGNSWKLVNGVNDLASRGPTEPVSITGVPTGVSTIGNSVKIYSPATAALVDSSAVPGRPDYLVNTKELTTWMQPISSVVGVSSGKPIVMVRVNRGGQQASQSGSSLLQRDSAGNWIRLGGFGSATGLTTVDDGRSLVTSGCWGIYETDPSDPSRRHPDLTWVQRVGGSSAYSEKNNGCIINPSMDGSAGTGLGFVHSVGGYGERQVVVAQSRLFDDERWQNVVSRVDLATGKVADLEGLDFTERGLLPVHVAVGDDSRLCIVTLSADGANPLFVTVDGVTRRVGLPDGMRANGCAWNGSDLIVIDESTGDTFVVNSVDRWMHF